MMKAWELIEKTGWCQGAIARDSNGTPVFKLNEPAASYCAAGAIEVCYPTKSGQSRNEYKKLRLSLGEWVSKWNDAPGRTKEEVVAKLKELDI